MRIEEKKHINIHKLRLNPTCFYHPIKVLFLDDNRNFLDSLELELSSNLDMLTCTDYKEAMKVIDKSSEDINKVTIKILDHIDVDTTTDHLIDIEISNIHKTIYDKSRFNYIAIVVIDYKMPTINGIEFCRLIRNKRIMKVILTARADRAIAIKAFNDGIIDKFLLKHNENLHKELLQAIVDLQYRYFANLSQTIIAGLGVKLESLLRSNIYLNLFNRTKERANAVEYYLIDRSGSFLFLDKNARPTWLIIRNKIDLDQQMKLVEGLDAPDSILSPLKKREKLLFLLSKHEYCKPIRKWGDFLFNVKQLDTNYYFSIIQDKTKNSVKWDKIKAYQPSIIT